MVAMVQRLDARSFFFRPQLSVRSFLALFFKVFRNRLNCHGLQCGKSISVQAVQFWPLRDKCRAYTRKRGSLRHTEVSEPMKVASGLSLAVERPASHATHEPHNHQNHNNCSEHTHT